MPDRAPDHVIPFGQLPPGFGAALDGPEGPAAPRPAATIILVRDAEGGGRGSRRIQVLLLRRARSTGFVPGAWVFPGGRVDRADGEAPLLARLRGVDPEALEGRLGQPSEAGGPRAAAFLVAALREAFEETGIPFFQGDGGGRLPSAAEDEEVERLRRRLLSGDLTFLELLREVEGWMDGGAAEYIAHWITPEAEPRRYDTRFFAAVVPAGTRAVVDDGEITGAIWLSPEEALERHRVGRLPMVFPTVRTLEAFLPFRTSREVLEHHRNLEIPPILPRLVRTPTGVGIRIPTEE
jgi:8-oxo-dGTP pyrophosphatase MutT (NUDIX family)